MGHRSGDVDFKAVVDHAHHAVSKGTQEFLNELSLEVEWDAQEFSYADELEDKAKEKKREKEMIIAIVGALLLTASAAIAGVALYAEPIFAGVTAIVNTSGRLGVVASRPGKSVQVGARLLRFPGENGMYGKGLPKQMGNINQAVGGFITGSFIGVTDLMKEASKIKHGDDE
jgi:uncharacterized membrane protein